MSRLVGRAYSRAAVYILLGILSPGSRVRSPYLSSYGLSQQRGFHPLSQTLSNHFCRGPGRFDQVFDKVFDEVREIQAFGTSSSCIKG